MYNSSMFSHSLGISSLDMVRKQERELKSAGRGLDRDLHSLEREEKKLVSGAMYNSVCV